MPEADKRNDRAEADQHDRRDDERDRQTWKEIDAFWKPAVGALRITPQLHLFLAVSFPGATKRRPTLSLKACWWPWR